jgi:hypothetical protein
MSINTTCAMPCEPKPRTLCESICMYADFQRTSCLQHCTDKCLRDLPENAKRKMIESCVRTCEEFKRTLNGPPQ